MKQFKKQYGWTKFGALGIVLSTLIGALSLGWLVQFIPDTAKITMPWVLVSLFLLPLTFSYQLYTKVSSLKDEKHLSNSEKRRLAIVIEGKERQLTMAMIFYVLSAVSTTILFVMFSYNLEIMKIMISVFGGFLGISIFSMALIFLEVKKIIDFRSRLIQRHNDKKKQRATLKKLGQITRQ